MSEYPKSNSEAVARFKKYKSKDPLPDIPPALLNSADIEDYVRETGMIYPFYPEDLKSASYEVRLRGKCIYWDEKGEKHTLCLEKKGDRFFLKPNSIAFVTPQPVFRLPDYIALRFNLRIRNVHRGLLLGTGPLVDPGFEGQLLIPLHNLTKNEYIFECDEGLIWVEFTKLSPNKLWENNPFCKNRLGKYIPFPEDKKNLPAEFYLGKALQNHSASTIQSSIPDVIQNAQRFAEESAQAAEKSATQAEDAVTMAKSMRLRATIIGVVAALALVAALVTMVFQVYGLIQDATSYTRQNSQILNDQIKLLGEEVRDLKTRLDSFSKSMDKIPLLEREMQGFKTQLDNLSQTPSFGSTEPKTNK